MACFAAMKSCQLRYLLPSYPRTDRRFLRFRVLKHAHNSFVVGVVKIVAVFSGMLNSITFSFTCRLFLQSLTSILRKLSVVPRTRDHQHTTHHSRGKSPLSQSALFLVRISDVSLVLAGCFTCADSIFMFCFVFQFDKRVHVDV